MAYYCQSDLLNDILSVDRKRKRKPNRKNHKRKGTYHKWLTARDNCGYMPIHIAAQFGCVKVFRILWEASDSTIPGTMDHLRGYRGADDRIQLVKNGSLANRTKDGQFSFLSLSLFLRFFKGEHP